MHNLYEKKITNVDKEKEKISYYWLLTLWFCRFFSSFSAVTKLIGILIATIVLIINFVIDYVHNLDYDGKPVCALGVVF